MATSIRARVITGLSATALLGSAWLVTTADERAEPAPGASGRSGSETTASEPGAPGVDLGGLTFTDITEAAGLDEPQAAAPLQGDDVMAGGAAVADYDDDGDLDVLLTRIGLPNRLMQNSGSGKFTDVAKEAGLGGADVANGYAAAVWADIDGDADLDLLVTGAGRAHHRLYVNDGSGHFQDDSGARGLGTDPAPDPLGSVTYGAAFDDWDHDGDLDLMIVQWNAPELAASMARAETGGDTASVPHICDYVGGLPDPDGDFGDRPPSGTQMLRNDGTGRFENITASSGVDVDSIQGFQPQFADIDGDGWNDLLVTGDLCTSRIYRNEAGTGFRDVTAASGVGRDENGMGSVVEDIDGDGHLDWFITSIRNEEPDGSCAVVQRPVRCTGNRLYLGDGTGHFRDATDEFGVRNGSWGWGAAAQDLNDDGHRDLVMTNGMSFSRPRDTDPGSDPIADLRAAVEADATRLWLGAGQAPWPEVAQAVGIDDRANGKALVTFDADGDGDLDVLVANTVAAPILYRNGTRPGPMNRHLTIRLRDRTGPNPYGVGARVEVDLGDGSTPKPLMVRAGGSFQSSDPAELHLGLGTRDRVARIEVTWPGDAESRVLTDVAADQTIEITRAAPSP